VRQLARHRLQAHIDLGKGVRRHLLIGCPSDNDAFALAMRMLEARCRMPV